MQDGSTACTNCKALRFVYNMFKISVQIIEERIINCAMVVSRYTYVQHAANYCHSYFEHTIQGVLFGGDTIIIEPRQVRYFSKKSSHHIHQIVDKMVSCHNVRWLVLLDRYTFADTFADDTHTPGYLSQLETWRLNKQYLAIPKIKPNFLTHLSNKIKQNSTK